MEKPKEKLKKKTYRTPQLQKDILDNTKWEEYGYINDSDLIRRSVDRTLEELNLLNRKKNQSTQ
jgi:hypothetical protein